MEKSFRNKTKVKVPKFHKNLKTNTEDKILDYCREKDSIAIFVSGAPYGATGGSQRPQQIAEGLAKKGYGCIHLAHLNGNSLKNIGDNKIGVLNVNDIETIMQHCSDIKNKIFYSAFPEKFSYRIYKILPNWFKIYDCVDEWSNFESAKCWFKTEYEKYLASQSDLVLGTARSLSDKFINGRFLPNSTKVDVTGRNWSAQRNIDLTFVGFLNEEWIAFNIFRLLSKKYTIRIIGDPPNDARKFKSDNVEWSGKKDVSEIVRLMSEAKVGIIPFKDQPLVHAVNPIKMFDYLAAGLPTVARYMPEVPKTIKYGYSCNSTQQFFDTIDWCLKNKWNRKDILKEAENHTIDKRIEVLMQWIPSI